MELFVRNKTFSPYIFFLEEWNFMALLYLEKEMKAEDNQIQDVIYYIT